jgi:hypothetical protein
MMRQPDAVVALCASFTDSATHARLSRTSRRFRRVTETALALPACVTVRSLYHIRGRTKETKLLERLRQTMRLEVHVTNTRPLPGQATNWTTGGAAAMMTILLQTSETRLRRLTVVVADDAPTPPTLDRVLNAVDSSKWKFDACTRFEVCGGAESWWWFDAMRHCMPNVTAPMFCDAIDCPSDSADTRNRQVTFVCSSHLERAPPPPPPAPSSPVGLII